MKKHVMKILAVGTISFLSLCGNAAPADAAGAGQAYALGSTAVMSGPCLNNGSVKEVAIAARQYKEVSTKSTSEGDVLYFYFTDYGFNRAYQYLVCVNGNGGSGYYYRYYGADDGKITRQRTTTQVCYGDSCYPSVTSYSAWASHDWI